MPIGADYYVYALTVEGKGRPFYIGMGRGRRMYAHVRAILNGSMPRHNPSLYQYIADVLASGLKVSECKLAEALTKEQADVLERHLVDDFGRADLGKGCLLNMRDGGNRAANYSAATRLRLGNSSRGKTVTPEVRQKMSLAHIGQIRTLAHREKLRIVGKNMSGERRHKFTEAVKTIEAQTRRLMSLRSPEVQARILASLLSPETSVKKAAAMKRPEVRARQSAAMKVRHTCPVFKAKVSRLGSKASPETRAKISKSLTGKKQSAETRAKKSKIMSAPERRANIVAAFTTPAAIARKAEVQRDPEFRSRVAAASRANLTPERAAKMKEAQRSPESRAKMSAAQRAMMTPERRAKIAETQRRVASDPEHRKRQSERMRGRSLSTEHKAKISEGLSKAPRPVKWWR